MLIMLIIMLIIVILAGVNVVFKPNISALSLLQW